MRIWPELISFMKDFDQWNSCKKQLETEITQTFFHEKEVWFVALGVNLGNEQDGKGERFWRPVIVLKKFNTQIFLAVPMTSKVRYGKYYFSFNLASKTRTALLSQVRLLDSKRMIRKIGNIGNAQFEILRLRLFALIK